MCSSRRISLNFDPFELEVGNVNMAVVFTHQKR